MTDALDPIGVALLVTHALDRVQAGRMDSAYLEAQADVLGVSDVLARALAIVS